MSFVSLEFYLFLAAVVIIYYCVPLKVRWYVLLAGSVAFFGLVTEAAGSAGIFFSLVLVSWAGGLLLERSARKENADRILSPLLFICILLTALPLLISKMTAMLGSFVSSATMTMWSSIIPIGLSFYTLQMISYLADVRRGTVRAQHNLLKYALFVSFFPQIVQGPIPRYNQLESQLIEGHPFDADGFRKGFMNILWGFFLKMMIADKAGIIVDSIFADPDSFQGAYVIVGGVLYSIQLYADFLACVTLAQGAAELFGVRLVNNFDHPYLAASIKDFWGRWHISLSSWLRDYVYIPFGGNRKGKLRKYLNLTITFAVSGLWHGSGIQYLAWGMMHAGYEIIGELTLSFRDAFFEKLKLPHNGCGRQWIRRGTTFLLVTAAWVIFRADSLGQGLSMLRSVIFVWNPWIFFDDSLLSLGLVWKEWMMLTAAILILIYVSRRQIQFSIRDRILSWPVWARCGLCIFAILTILVFGTYGYGYDAADFIYRGF